MLTAEEPAVKGTKAATCNLGKSSQQPSTIYDGGCLGNANNEERNEPQRNATK
jgi:hypothetical protein